MKLTPRGKFYAALIVMATVVLSVMWSRAQVAARVRPITISEVETVRRSNGSIEHRGIFTRYVGASGTNLEVKTLPDGREVRFLTDNATGKVYRISDASKTAYVMGEATRFLPPERTPEDFLKHKQYARTDKLLNETAYVLNVYGDGEEITGEAWYVPTLAAFPLKLVTYDGDNTYVREAVSVKVGDPSPELLRIPEGYRVADLPITVKQ